MKNRKNFILILFNLCFSLVLISGCAVDEIKLADSGESKIRIINASPDESVISVTINDTLRTPKPLKFSQNTAYQSVSAGNRLVSTSAEKILSGNANLNFLFKNDKRYSVFIAGKIAKDSLVYITLEDNFIGANDTTARVRFLNASPNSTNLEAAFSTNLRDSLTNLSSTAFRSSTLYQSFKPGNYTIKVRASRNTGNLAVGANFNIVAGKYYTIWMKGLKNETGVFALTPVLLTDN